MIDYEEQKEAYLEALREHKEDEDWIKNLPPWMVVPIMIIFVIAAILVFFD